MNPYVYFKSSFITFKNYLFLFCTVLYVTLLFRIVSNTIFDLLPLYAKNFVKIFFLFVYIFIILKIASYCGFLEEVIYTLEINL